MVVARAVINGIVKNGLIVPLGDSPLPEGSHVEIRLALSETSEEFEDEFVAWEKAGDEAWAMIDKWEKEEIS